MSAYAINRAFQVVLVLFIAYSLMGIPVLILRKRWAVHEERRANRIKHQRCIVHRPNAHSTHAHFSISQALEDNGFTYEGSDGRHDIYAPPWGSLVEHGPLSPGMRAAGMAMQYPTHTRITLPRQAPDGLNVVVNGREDLPGPLANYHMDADGTVRRVAPEPPRPTGWGHDGILPLLRPEPLPEKFPWES
jgi:hypothetical protein